MTAAGLGFKGRKIGSMPSVDGDGAAISGLATAKEQILGLDIAMRHLGTNKKRGEKGFN